MAASNSTSALVTFLGSHPSTAAWPKSVQMKLARDVVRIDKAHAARERREERAAYRALRVEFPKLPADQLKGLAASIVFDIRLARRAS